MMCYFGTIICRVREHCQIRPKWPLTRIAVATTALLNVADAASPAQHAHNAALLVVRYCGGAWISRTLLLLAMAGSKSKEVKGYEGAGKAWHACAAVCVWAAVAFPAQTGGSVLLAGVFFVMQLDQMTAEWPAKTASPPLRRSSSTALVASKSQLQPRDETPAPVADPSKRKRSKKSKKKAE